MQFLCRIQQDGGWGEVPKLELAFSGETNKIRLLHVGRGRERQLENYKVLHGMVR